MGSFNPTAADLVGTKGLSKEKKKLAEKTGTATKKGKGKAEKAKPTTVQLSQTEILRKLAKGEITEEEAGQLLDSKKQTGMYCRANPDTGCISLYGLQRMPISLYRNQWERLLPGCDRAIHPVLMFIDEHSKYLPEQKGDKVEKVPADMIGEGKPFRVPAVKEN